MADQEQFTVFHVDGTQDQRKTIKQAISTGENLRLIVHSIKDSIEHEINFVLAALLDQYEQEQLQSTLYSCLKELLVNAVKANAKRVFFEEMGIEETSGPRYEQGLRLFKDNLTESWVENYCHKALDKGLDVRIDIFHSRDGLRIEVINQLEISSEDEARIREKFATGMSYDDLVSFYLDHADKSEGEGLGFAMNVLLLKGEQINPALFRVGTGNGKTIARLEIPFTEDFISVRGPNPEGHQSRD